MPRTGENIYKRKDGRWEGRYIRERINGKACYASVYARSYREVKEKLNTAKIELEQRKLPREKAGNVTDIARLWLAESAGDLKQTSVFKYEDLLRCYILPQFGDEELSDITNEQMMRFVSDLRMHGGVRQQGLKASTVSEVISTMNALRVYALKRDRTVMFSPECVSVKQEKKEIRVFSMEEERRLIQHIRTHMDRTSLGILLCLYTGLRIGELCALTWDDFNLTEHTVKVGRTMQRIRVNNETGRKTAVKIFEPKSACSIRTIPIPDVLMEFLQEYYTPGAYVLSGESKCYVEPRTMQYRFKHILKACGIHDANFHTTRHTFATRCIELGFDVKSLSEILGHASVAITMNRYVHPTMELKTENMNRFSRLFVE